MIAAPPAAGAWFPAPKGAGWHNGRLRIIHTPKSKPCNRSSFRFAAVRPSQSIRCNLRRRPPDKQVVKLFF